ARAALAMLLHRVVRRPAFDDGSWPPAAEDFERALRQRAETERELTAPADEGWSWSGSANEWWKREPRTEALNQGRSDGADDPGAGRQARSRRARSRRQGGGGRAARRRHGGDLHRTPSVAGPDRRGRGPGRRGRGRALDPVGRAHDAVPRGAGADAAARSR